MTSRRLVAAFIALIVAALAIQSRVSDPARTAAQATESAVQESSGIAAAPAVSPLPSALESSPKSGRATDIVTAASPPGTPAAPVTPVTPATGPAAAPPAPVDLDRSFAIIDGHRVHPTRLIAKPLNGTEPARTREKLLGDLFLKVDSRVDSGALILDTLGPKPGAVADETEAKRLGAELVSRMKGLKRSGLFEYVEPDYIVRALDLPTDSGFNNGTLWGLRNQGESGGVVGADIDAVRAWEITTGSTNVIVAVIDSGVRYTHQDLAPQMWRNPGEIPGNGIDDDGDGYVDDVFGINAINNTGDPNDDNSHGTHCAGTIGAAANGSGPHVGVAWKVRIMACKFLGATGRGATSDSIKCIDFATRKGARILSNSWGGGPFSQAVLDSINRARARGVLFVAAAGNESNNNDSNPAYPASFRADNVISVAAVDRQDKLADFSNFGATSVHVAAPGVAIYSSIKDSDQAYASFNGTSMATPHVSGIAALILAQFPDLGAQAVRQRILSSVVRIPSLRGKTTTGGRVNAFRALSDNLEPFLEIAVSPAETVRLDTGLTRPFFVSVTANGPVTNATVIGRIAGRPEIRFSNTGRTPDVTAADGTYSAEIVLPGANTLMTLVMEASAPGAISSTNTVTYQVRGPLVNDAFASATILSGTSVQTIGANNGATSQSGEPSHAGSAATHSVWWRWTAPAAGPVVIHTEGSTFDTVLGVYTGNSVNALSLVASNDDGSSGNSSRVTFTAVSGRTYQIAVDGYGGAEGDIRLTLNQTASVVPPGNDRFISRIVVSGTNEVVVGSSTNATAEVGEPAHAGLAASRSVWWSWTAPASGVATFTTDGSDFDTTLAVYSGTSLASLTPVASDNDGGEGPQSRLQFNAIADATYAVAVDGAGGAFGRVRLGISLFVPPVSPQNDRFADRLAVTGPRVQLQGTNAGATREDGEPQHAANLGGRSVWWTWTPPISGTARVTLTNSAFSPLVAVYTGSALGQLVEVASGSSAAGRGTVFAFRVTAGIPIQVAVDGRNDGFGAGSGTFDLELGVTADGAVPANDLFAGRISVAGTNVTISGRNVGAGREPGEPQITGNAGGRSVWWTWTAPSTGAFAVTTAGSPFDTLLGIYTGSAVGSLTPVAQDDDGGGDTTSRVLFDAVAGTAYQIAVDGFSGESGPITLSLRSEVRPVLALDAFEPDNTPADAKPIRSGENQRRSLHAAGESDLAYFDITGTARQVVIETSGPEGDTQLTLFAASAPTSPIAFNDDTPGSRFSRISVAGLPPGRYLVRVNEYDVNALIPDYTLRVDWRRSNDRFDEATRLEGPIGRAEANNSGYSREGSEPTHQVPNLPAENVGQRSAWWTWTAPASSPVTVHTRGSDFDTVLAVYTGNSLGSLQPVARNDDIDTDLLQSEVEFQAVQGVQYWFAVDGFRYSDPEFQSEGAVVLNWNCSACSGVNDAFALAFVIGNADGRAVASNVNFSREPGEPTHQPAGLPEANIGSRSAWWAWTAARTATVTFETVASRFDTVLAAYTGASLGSLTRVAQNDDLGPEVLQSRIRFPAVAGTTYHIVVDGFLYTEPSIRQDQGEILLNWRTDGIAERPRLEVLAATPQPVLRIQGPAGTRWQVQSASHLGGAWENVGEGVAGAEWNDPRPASTTQRYYRLFQP